VEVVPDLQPQITSLPVMRLVLTRGGPSDFDQMVPLTFRAFEGDPLLPVFFGHESPTTHQHVKDGWAKGLKETSDIWTTVVDLDAEEVAVGEIPVRWEKVTTKQKRIVGACNWRVYPTYIPPKEEEKRGIDEEYAYLPTHQERVDAARLVPEYMANRREECNEPHVLCYMLFVDPDYQGKGVGKMLMRWGMEVADSLMLPVWLESSQKGLALYKGIGFEETSRKVWETESFGRCSCLRMKRGVKVESWEWSGKGDGVRKTRDGESRSTA
jgi:GNAT superfamily N-acetyltransferase